MVCFVVCFTGRRPLDQGTRMNLSSGEHHTGQTITFKSNYYTTYI